LQFRTIDPSDLNISIRIQLAIALQDQQMIEFLGAGLAIKRALHRSEPLNFEPGNPKTTANLSCHDKWNCLKYDHNLRVIAFNAPNPWLSSDRTPAEINIIDAPEVDLKDFLALEINLRFVTNHRQLFP